MITGYMARYNKSPAKAAVAAYAEIALKYGLTPTQLALAWCYQRPSVTSTIIGATTSEQLKVSLECFLLRLHAWPEIHNSRACHDHTI